MAAAGDITRIVLVRHAEAHANVRGILGGHQGCTGLTDRGRQQARLLRDRLADSRLLADATTAVTSKLARAVETFQAIAPAVGNGRLEATRDCGFCDPHWGDLDGTAAEDFREPSTIYEPCAPQGESWIGFMRRARRALRQLASLHAGETSVVVTHGGVIKASLLVYGGPDYADFPDEVGYSAITIWTGLPDDGWRLNCYGDESHLER